MRFHLPKAIQGALLVAGSLVLSMLLAEAAAREFLPQPYRPAQTSMHQNGFDVVLGRLHRPDAKIGWVLSPDPKQFHHRRSDDKGVVAFDVVYSLAAGKRQIPAVPLSGPLLIATGCSFTFGHGLNDADTWPAQLQQKLPNYRVVSVAAIGYGTDQALLAAERELQQHKGQIGGVVLGFADFHIQRNRSAQSWLVTAYPFSKPLFALRSGKVEYQGQVRYWEGGLAVKYSDLFAHILNVSANRVYRIPSYENARELTVGLICDFARRWRPRV